ncbi:MAG TPA: hypothetical protein V6D12_02880 [Candidatus Obscuribacterales bacterium]
MSSAIAQDAIGTYQPSQIITSTMKAGAALITQSRLFGRVACSLLFDKIQKPWLGYQPYDLLG